MRLRSVILAAATALAALLAAPAAGLAADMPGYVPAAEAPYASCGSLHPSNVYVPPQTAYIVACTVALPPTFGKRANPLWYEGKLVYFNGWENRRPAVHLLVVPK
jgi:hypothetical protein